MEKKTTKKRGSDVLRKIATGGDSVKEKKYAKDVAQVRRRLNIAGQIYRLRKDAGLTQAELAEKAGIQRSAVARLESETYRGYSVPTLEKIVKVFKGHLEVKLVVGKPVQRRVTARKKTSATAKKKTSTGKRSKVTA